MKTKISGHKSTYGPPVFPTTTVHYVLTKRYENGDYGTLTLSNEKEIKQAIRTLRGLLKLTKEGA